MTESSFLFLYKNKVYKNVKPHFYTKAGKENSTYKNALKELNIEELEKRREILCLEFAKNA